MSLKIKISYEQEQEINLVLRLLQPIVPMFKVKKSNGSTPYKHLYLIPRQKQNWPE